MNSANKCPYTSTKLFLGKIVGFFADTVKNRISDLLGPDKAFTYEFARKEIGITSFKKEFYKKYMFLSMRDIQSLLDQGSEEDIKNFYSALNHEISIHIFEKILIKIEQNPLSRGNEKHEKSEGFISELSDDILKYLTDIKDNVLNELYQEVEMGRNSRIHQIMRLQNDIHQTSEINTVLSSTLSELGIENTVYQIHERFVIFLGHMKKFDRNKIGKLIKDDERTWNQRAISGMPHGYARAYEKCVLEGNASKRYMKGSRDLIYDPTLKAILPNITQKNFKKITKFIKKILQETGSEERESYVGCPLLYMKTEINGEKVNGITGLQRIIYNLFLTELEEHIEIHKKKKDS